MRILLLEDDPVMGEILEEFLQRFYTVDRVEDTVEAQKHLDTHTYALLVFDINVPGSSGIELLKSIRECDNATPALIISSNHDLGSLERSFEAGAHDYIKKPFALEELKLRIEKSRKLFSIDANTDIQIDTLITYSPKRKVVIQKKQEHIFEIALRPKEAQLLEYFMNHPGQWILKEELCINLWNYTDIPSDATLRSYIRKLRNIIGKEKITTRRGLGYRYETS